MKVVALSAVKAVACSVTATIGVGLLFAGSVELIGILSDSWCTNWPRLCGVARFWVSYWWLAFGVICYPTAILFFWLFIRRFAPIGERLAATGLVLIFFATGSLVAGAVEVYLGRRVGPSSWLLLGLAVDFAILSLGVSWLSIKALKPN